jgi:hypothetical protein
MKQRHQNLTQKPHYIRPFTLNSENNTSSAPPGDSAAVVSGVIKDLRPDWNEVHGALIQNAPFSTGTNELAGQITSRLFVLRAAALAGDSAAYEVIVRLASMSCGILETANFLHAEVQNRLAKEMTDIPTLISFHRGNREKTLDRIRQLPLAENLSLVKTDEMTSTSTEGGEGKVRRRRSYSFDSVANQTVYAEFLRLKVLNPERYDLGKSKVAPPVLRRWFEDIWKEILKRGAPESQSQLRWLGLGLANSKGSQVGSKTYEANVRDGIRQRLREAFKTVFIPKE